MIPDTLNTYLKQEWPRYGEIIEEFQQNGRRHRDGGPAFIYSRDGNIVSKEYYIQGKRHRDDGPAVLEYSDVNKEVVSREEYYRNGRLHRQGGPAVIVRASDGNIVASEYWLDGRILLPKAVGKGL
jgi:antitoxin component YwqK of YwqJK toxin-antitoxin module